MPGSDSTAVKHAIQSIEQSAGIAMELARQERYTQYPDGRRESIAEHIVMLGLVALEVAARYYPDIDLGQVALEAFIHDLSEVKGDIPTLGISEEGLADKKSKEASDLVAIRDEYPMAAEIIGMASRYDPEGPSPTDAQMLVFVLDKIVASIPHLRTNMILMTGIGITSREKLLEACEQTKLRVEKLQDKFPFLVDLWWAFIEKEAEVLELLENDTYLVQSVGDSV